MKNAFGQKAKINVNATGQKKGLWFKISPFCKTCKDHSGKSTSQTLAHILGSCAIERGISSEDPRNSVTWRHNEIRKKVADSLNNELDISYKVMVVY
jgi:hypothetical protein